MRREKGRSHRQLMGDRSVILPLTGLAADGCGESTDENTWGLVPIRLGMIIWEQAGHLESMGHSSNWETLTHFSAARVMLCPDQDLTVP